VALAVLPPTSVMVTPTAYWPSSRAAGARRTAAHVVDRQADVEFAFVRVGVITVDGKATAVLRD
jgi:hypothetical protein